MWCYATKSHDKATIKPLTALLESPISVTRITYKCAIILSCARSLILARDGPWTFEISDKGYRVRPEAGERTMWKPVTVAPLYQHLAHPGMREAYPQFSEVPSMLNIEPSLRSYGRSTADRLEIDAPDLQTARSVGIHELKHMIDRLEQHAPGGSPDQFRGPGISEQEAYDLYQRLVGEVAARNTQQRLLMSERQRRLQSPQSTESVPRDQQINLYEE
jgi:hypothetical protein